LIKHNNCLICWLVAVSACQVYEASPAVPWCWHYRHQ